MERLSQTLEIIFKVQRKRRNEKNNKKKNKFSNLQNRFFFPSLRTTPNFKSHNFLIFYSF
jgi:hypothetical protein